MKQSEEIYSVLQEYSDDIDKIEQLIREYAQKGNDIAMQLLMVCDENKQIEDEDIEKIKYSKELIDFLIGSDLKEQKKYQHILGEIYYEGLGVNVDYKKAKTWYQKSADQGYTCAEYMMGNMYYSGDGVEVDYRKAIEWYKKAARQDSDAQFMLAQMYYSGEGTKLNYNEAIRWYRKAANNGDLDAQYMMGQMYIEGEGVEENINEALRWFTEAAAYGDFDSLEIIRNLEDTTGNEYKN